MNISIDEFSKSELKIGTIKEAEKIEGSNKLLKLQVDLGAGEDGQADMRQILSGIAQHYEPEDIVGRQVVVIANLEPREMMGMESQGMLLAADDGSGPIILFPEREVSSGAEIH